MDHFFEKRFEKKNVFWGLELLLVFCLIAAAWDPTGLADRTAGQWALLAGPGALMLGFIYRCLRRTAASLKRYTAYTAVFFTLHGTSLLLAAGYGTVHQSPARSLGELAVFALLLLPYFAVCVRTIHQTGMRTAGKVFLVLPAASCLVFTAAGLPGLGALVCLLIYEAVFMEGLADGNRWCAVAAVCTGSRLRTYGPAGFLLLIYAFLFYPMGWTYLCELTQKIMNFR